jgi:hypothetical protein
MNATKLFFDHITIIKWKYEKVLQQTQQDFNVFSILRSETDEVNLHSRFLAELLNPKGTHNQGKTLLGIFLKQVDLSNFKLENIYVKREYKDIDIFIANETQAIILENKIYAEDQPEQLARYHRVIQKQGIEDISVIYLTLNGDAPSGQSMGGIVANSPLHIVSYKDDIDVWLEECIKQAAQYPVLRETLIQYQQLIRKLTGKSLVKGYIMEIKDFLLDEKNIELAVDVNQALSEAKIDIQFNFWEELAKKLAAKNHKIFYLEDYSYSRSLVENFYRGGRNRRHYGILIEIQDLGDSEILMFYVEINWWPFYGFSVYQRQVDDWANAEEEKFDYLVDIVKTIDNNFTLTDDSIGWKEPNRKLDFETFNSKDIFALADAIKRSNIVNELVDEISSIINKFNERYEQYTFARRGT